MKKGAVLFGVALLSGAGASIVTAQVMQVAASGADDARVFELNIYHASPGKVGALEARFREAQKLQARHGLKVIGYRVPYDAPAWQDSFIYVVAHASRGDADRNWRAFHEDPEFQKYVRAEETEHLIENVDTVYMRPTDYSKMR